MPPERRPRAAIVVAHPDDEVIFFGGLAMRLVADGRRLDVICVTGDFGSPYTTGVRRAEFYRACGTLGAKARMLGLPDAKGPLDEAALASAFAVRVRWQRYARVYTHGPWGEYGHPHHVQVCRAAHRCGRNVLSLAGPFAPDAEVRLSPAELDRKRALAARLYPSQPFARHWCADREDVVELSLEAIEFLTAIALHGDAAPPADLPELLPTAVHAEPAFPGVTYVPGELWRDGHRARLDALRDRR
jgi:LmbE family N-acetylglucosaminyl deacetylase